MAACCWFNGDLLAWMLTAAFPFALNNGFLPKNRAKLQDNHNVFNECPWNLETGNWAFVEIC
jgi:hypothetical protein